MSTTYFIVRATVADPAKRAAFDKWYEQEHVPDAVKTFGAQKAWRFWSESDPAVHMAWYRFAETWAVSRFSPTENSSECWRKKSLTGPSGSAGTGASGRC